MLRLILVGIFSCCLISCSAGDSNESEDPVLRAYRMIDEQRTDEAITFLEGKLSEKPGDYDLTITLVSAYAHKGGVKIQKFIPLIKQISQMQELIKQKDEELKQKEKETETGKENGKDDSGNPAQSSKDESVHVTVGKDSFEFELRDLAFGFNQIGVFLGLYASIPDLEPEKVVYVNHAIQMMNNLGPRLKLSDKAFRVVLSIVRFKSWISENLVGEAFSILNSKTKSASDCIVDTDRARKQGLLGLRLVNGILKDVAEIRPEIKDKIQSILSRSDEAIQALTESVRSGKDISEEGKHQLTYALDQKGFGKILKCDGDSARP